MVVGINPAVDLLEISKKEHIEFSEALFNYTYSDLNRRIAKSDYVDIFPKVQSDGVNSSKKIDLFFVSSRKYPQITNELVNDFIENAFSSIDEINWSYTISESDKEFYCNLNAEYKEMEVPFVVKIRKTTEEEQRFFNYSAENTLCEEFMEIMTKLELIGDMKSYYVINESLKKQNISGRYVMEIISSACEKNPKLLNIKRIETIEGYKSYGYMNKKWQQFCKRNGCEIENWEEVIDRICCFGKPIWTALCNNEIFFDDWMPELGRFLG